MSSTIQNSISINNRTEIEIKGVKDIISYDSEKVILDMSDSELTLTGTDFYIKKIDVDNHCAYITGCFSALSFNDPSIKTAGFLTRLFR